MNTRPKQQLLDAYGVDAVCEDIGNRTSLTDIAKAQGVSIGTLLTWISAEPERSARVREARSAMARIWDEQAEREIRDAEDDMALRRAKELAHHYRWRASKVSPEYNDKLSLEHSGSLQTAPDEQIDARFAALMARAREEA